MILVESLCREHDIGLNGIYNADQFGLLYKQYPNRVIIDKNERSTFRGVKAMKDKNRISIMACTNAIGEKVPLAVCGKHKKPLCFNNETVLPCPYTNQTNAWYSRDVMRWWFKNVFKGYVQKNHGDNHIILILDNLDAHTALKDWDYVPKNIHILFLPPNLTSKYQPMDQGVIATLKIGYKMLMLKFLLVICDDVDCFEQFQNTVVPKGCRGLEHGSAPHILDALKLLKMLWEGEFQGRYSDPDAIARCWRKSNCLPPTMIAELNKDYGRSDINTQSIDDQTLDEMCDLISRLKCQVSKMANIPAQLEESVVCIEDLNREELIEGLQFHCELDELPILEDVIIDESITQLMQSDLLQPTKNKNQEIQSEIKEESNNSAPVGSTKTASTSDIASTLELLQQQLYLDKFTDETKHSFNALASKVKTELINKRHSSLKQKNLYSFYNKNSPSSTAQPILQDLRDCSPASTLTNSSHTSSLLKRKLVLEDTSTSLKKQDISFQIDKNNPGEIIVEIRYSAHFFCNQVINF